MTQIVVNQVLMIFLLIGFGYLLRKLNVMNDGFTKGATDLIIYVTLPAMVLASMDREFSKELASNGLVVFFFGALMYLTLSIIAFVFVKLRGINDSDKGVYLYMVIFGNVGYLGYPIANIAFGDIGVFYTAFFNIWFQILTWTLGVKLMSKEKIRFTKLILNPGLLATSFGVMIFFFSWDLPIVVKSTLETIGSMTVPLAMFIVGAFLADAKFSDFLSKTDLYIAAIAKLVIGPLLMALILFKMDLPLIVKAIPIIMSGMPSGVNTAIFAKIFGRDYKLASQGVVLSTAFSLISLPILLLLVL
ncbi:MAG: AEC family transporter [Pseudothermotoga sp.]